MSTVGAPSEGLGTFGRIALFFRQVIAELKKVVTPSRSELLAMTGSVLLFVLLIMIIVYFIDWLIRIGVFALFG